MEKKDNKQINGGVSKAKKFFTRATAFRLCDLTGEKPVHYWEAREEQVEYCDIAGEEEEGNQGKEKGKEKVDEFQEAQLDDAIYHSMDADWKARFPDYLETPFGRTQEGTYLNKHDFVKCFNEDKDLLVRAWIFRHNAGERRDDVKEMMTRMELVSSVPYLEYDSKCGYSLVDPWFLKSSPFEIMNMDSRVVDFFKDYDVDIHNELWEQFFDAQRAIEEQDDSEEDPDYDDEEGETDGEGWDEDDSTDKDWTDQKDD